MALLPQLSPAINVQAEVTAADTFITTGHLRATSGGDSTHMYAFVHIEKTGGSTLNTIFRRSFGARHCDVRLPLAKRPNDRHDDRVCVQAEDLRRVRRLYRNLRGISGHNVKPYAD